MEGSIDSQIVRVTTSPAAGLGMASSRNSKSSRRGLPDGRRFSTTERRLGGFLLISGSVTGGGWGNAAIVRQVGGGVDFRTEISQFRRMGPARCDAQPLSRNAPVTWRS